MDEQRDDHDRDCDCILDHADGDAIESHGDVHDRVCILAHAHDVFLWLNPLLIHGQYHDYPYYDAFDDPLNVYDSYRSHACYVYQCKSWK